MKDWKTANRYANALLMVAEDSKQLDRVYDDLRSIREVIRNTPDLVKFLRNPVINHAQKKSTFRSLFENKVSQHTLEFLYLLCSKNRENLLEEIIESFIQKHDERLGLIKAEVVSVVDLTKDQVNGLSARIKGMTGKSPELTFKKDPSLIGGFLVKIGDRVIDGSVRHQLQKLREQFLAQD